MTCRRVVTRSTPARCPSEHQPKAYAMPHFAWRPTSGTSVAGSVLSAASGVPVRGSCAVSRSGVFRGSTTPPPAGVGWGHLARADLAALRPISAERAPPKPIVQRPALIIAQRHTATRDGVGRVLTLGSRREMTFPPRGQAFSPRLPAGRLDDFAEFGSLRLRTRSKKEKTRLRVSARSES